MTDDRSRAPKPPELRPEAAPEVVEVAGSPPEPAEVALAISPGDTHQSGQSPPGAKFSGKTEESRQRQLANLRPGGRQPSRQERRQEAREAARRGSPMSRDDVLGVLREIAMDEDQSGAYRTAAARLLLDPEVEETGSICWRCQRDTTEVPKSVAQWIDEVTLEEEQEAQTHRPCRCPECAPTNGNGHPVVALPKVKP